MYRVRQQGKIVKAFSIFTDAWLFAYLELDCFARIVGPDGVWIVNPGRHSVN